MIRRAKNVRARFSKNALWSVCSFFLCILASAVAYAGEQIEIDDLKGIKGVDVTVEETPRDLSAVGVTTQYVRTIVEVKFQQAGIFLPRITAFKMGAPTFWVAVNGVKPGMAYDVHCGIMDNVTLVRNPSKKLLARTWSRSSVGISPASELKTHVREALSDITDEFLNDYFKANPRSPQK